MEPIKITVANNIATVSKSFPLVAGTVGFPVEFTFDHCWTDLTKTVVFKVGDKCYDRVDIEASTTIPWELLQTPGSHLHLGVYGCNSDGSLQIPTVWVDLGPVRTGADPSGDQSADPSLPVWAEIIRMMGEVSPGGGGGTGNVWFVTVTYAGVQNGVAAYSADHTNQEIYEASQAGKFVCVSYMNQIFVPHTITATTASFMRHSLGYQVEISITNNVASLSSQSLDVTADKIYNSTSPNAQSGVAVAMAVAPLSSQISILGSSVSNLNGTVNDVVEMQGDFNADLADFNHRLRDLEQGGNIAEWELLEDITVSEEVVYVSLDVAKMNTKKEIHIEGRIIPTDTTVTSQAINLHTGAEPVFQANLSCKSGVIFLFCDVYKSGRGKTVYDGTFSIYDFALSGASFKISKMDANITEGDYNRLIDSDALLVRMSAANPIAAGTHIKVWGR